MPDRSFPLVTLVVLDVDRNVDEGLGSALGGIHWGMAIDNKRVYAAVTDIRIKQFANITLGDLFALTTIFGKAMYAAPGATPGIYALDLLTGNLVWERHDKHDFQGTAYDNIYSAALSVTNDVLFAGSLNGELKALRTSNGDQLWSFNTATPVVDVNGVSGNGGTMLDQTTIQRHVAKIENDAGVSTAK